MNSSCPAATSMPRASSPTSRWAAGLRAAVDAPVAAIEAPLED